MRHEDTAKSSLRRLEAMGAHFAALLSTRSEASGPQVMFVTFDEFERIQHDPDYSGLMSYARNLVEYADGTIRPHPVRPLLHNEVGVYKGRIVVMKGDNPDDDGRRWVQGGLDK